MSHLEATLREFCEPDEKWMRNPFLFRHNGKRYLVAVSDARVVIVECCDDTTAPLRRLTPIHKERLANLLDFEYRNSTALDAHKLAERLRQRGTAETRWDAKRWRPVNVINVKMFGTTIDANLVLPVLEHVTGTVSISYDKRPFMPVRFECGAWTIILAPVSKSVEAMKPDNEAMSAAIDGGRHA